MQPTVLNGTEVIAKMSNIVHSDTFFVRKAKSFVYYRDGDLNKPASWHLFSPLTITQVNTVSAALTVQQTEHRTTTSDKHRDKTPVVSTKKPANATDAEYRKQQHYETIIYLQPELRAC